MKKKILSLLMIIALVFACAFVLSACDNGGTIIDNRGKTSEQTSAVHGPVQSGQSVAGSVISAQSDNGSHMETKEDSGADTTYVRVDGSGAESATGKYMFYGEYPQTIKADGVNITSEKDSRGYYKGSDGAYYAKITANPYTIESDNTFSTGAAITKGTVYYFKVEPIKWRILKEENGTATILCEMIIDAHAYQDNYYYNSSDEEYYTIVNGEPSNIYAGDYKYSEIRRWLNDNFYNTAFNTLQKRRINTVTIVNDSAPYVGADTTDKVWLLSYQEVMKESYGFSTEFNSHDTARRKKTTDYAKANFAWTSTSNEYVGNGYWWLRSPYVNGLCLAAQITHDGNTLFSNFRYARNPNCGVVPALEITL